MTAKVTDKQRRAMEHVERARSEGRPLSDYGSCAWCFCARDLRRDGGVKAQGCITTSKPSSQSAFAAVRVKPAVQSVALPATPSGALICRQRIGAAVIECAQWPPAAWVTALVTGQADAAPWQPGD
jgi:hypothetical protein